jgi:ferrous iron transport protein A
MKLSELKKGEHAVIVKIDADKALKERLASLGMMRGEEIELKGCSIGKQTIEVDVGGTLIALRAEEAEKIEVERVENAGLRIKN